MIADEIFSERHSPPAQAKTEIIIDKKLYSIQGQAK